MKTEMLQIVPELGENFTKLGLNASQFDVEEQTALVRILHAHWSWVSLTISSQSLIGKVDILIQELTNRDVFVLNIKPLHPRETAKLPVLLSSYHLATGNGNKPYGDTIGAIRYLQRIQSTAAPFSIPRPHQCAFAFNSMCDFGVLLNFLLKLSMRVGGIRFVDLAARVFVRQARILNERLVKALRRQRFERYDLTILGPPNLVIRVEHYLNAEEQLPGPVVTMHHM